MDDDFIILQRKKWLRLIRNDRCTIPLNLYKIQCFSWFKWRGVTFGPFSPNQLGIDTFNSITIATGEYEKCLKQDKSYTLQGVTYNSLLHLFDSE